MIDFILWIIAGALIGWVASIIMKTNDRQGVIGDIFVGIVGAFVGGYFLSPLFDIGTINEGNYSLPALLVSLGGAVILLAISRLFRTISGFVLILLIAHLRVCQLLAAGDHLGVLQRGQRLGAHAMTLSPKWRRRILPRRGMRLGSIHCKMNL
jgi:uncharacterized membrane protein YeaQ/YmgE (transglycosylase-associated protein family)